MSAKIICEFCSSDNLTWDREGIRVCINCGLIKRNGKNYLPIERALQVQAVLQRACDLIAVSGCGQSTLEYDCYRELVKAVYEYKEMEKEK
jgi:hypothetical protein